MNKIDPHKTKYFDMYMRLAIEASKESVAVRRQVGAVIVLPNGLISLGWNGTVPGFDNTCEWQCEDAKGYDTGKTKPDVVHAERNALDKLTKSTVSSEDSILFTTTAPCLSCAVSIANAGIKEVIYLNAFSKTDGVDHLINRGVSVTRINYG